MRSAHLQGALRRHHGCMRCDPAASPKPDLVNSRFSAQGADRLWCMDVTQHRTGEGRAYRAVVLDKFSRRIVGWLIATICALNWSVMPWTWPAGGADCLRGKPSPIPATALNTPVEPSVNASARRPAGIAGVYRGLSTTAWSKAILAQTRLKLLDTRTWNTRRELANAIFDYRSVLQPDPKAFETRHAQPPWTTNEPTPPCTERHNQHTQPTRKIGPTSVLTCSRAKLSTLSGGPDMAVTAVAELAQLRDQRQASCGQRIEDAGLPLSRNRSDGGGWRLNAPVADPLETFGQNRSVGAGALIRDQDVGAAGTAR